MIALGALLLALGIVLLIYLRRESARQELLVERMRTSRAYSSLQPLLHRCASLYVERVLLRPEAVTVMLYTSPNEKQTYAFEENDMDPLEPLALEALAQLVTAEMPELGDQRKYSFHQHRERVGDEGVCWYEYMIHPAYKDRMLRLFNERYANNDRLP